ARRHSRRHAPQPREPRRRRRVRGRRGRDHPSPARRRPDVGGTADRPAGAASPRAPRRAGARAGSRSRAGRAGGRRAAGARRCRVMPTPAIPEYHARTPEAIDALERAVREHHRVALMRRGTEYVVVAERLEARGVGGGTEVLHGRLPMTGEVLEFALGDLEWFAVLP